MKPGPLGKTRNCEPKSAKVESTISSRCVSRYSRSTSNGRDNGGLLGFDVRLLPNLLGDRTHFQHRVYGSQAVARSFDAFRQRQILCPGLPQPIYSPPSHVSCCETAYVTLAHADTCVAHCAD